MKKRYAMPIKLEIDSENPDLDAKTIAESIHDAVERFGSEKFHGQYFDMEYSIYIKADEKVFSMLGH